MQIKRLLNREYRWSLVFFGAVLLLIGLLGQLSFGASGNNVGQCKLRNRAICHSILNSTVPENDDSAAVRWDYRCRSNGAVRLDNRQNLRAFTALHVVPENSGIVPDTTLSLSQVIYPLGYNEIKLIYYRRLWQKVLPMRAGPTA